MYMVYVIDRCLVTMIIGTAPELADALWSDSTDLAEAVQNGHY